MCDYLRMITLGSDTPHEMEALMDEEIDTHNGERSTVASAIQTMADGLPAFGNIAAVFGINKTMGSIIEPPEVLGKLISGALVGTFLGIFLSYGFVAPMATSLKGNFDAETKYFQCMKAALLAYMQGYFPAVVVKFGRKALMYDVRPIFYEVEEAVSTLPAS